MDTVVYQIGVLILVEVKIVNITVLEACCTDQV